MLRRATRERLALAALRLSPIALVDERATIDEPRAIFIAERVPAIAMVDDDRGLCGLGSGSGWLAGVVSALDIARHVAIIAGYLAA